MSGPARVKTQRDDAASGADEGADGLDRDLSATLSMATEPRTLAAVLATFVFILGVPTALFAYAGRWDAALGLLGLFAAMLVATGYAFKEAVEAQRILDDDG